ncbi:unnamed protein product [Trichobilharzia regenti]|nr:unnamed protein product [Trichobilharzia regenti]
MKLLRSIRHVTLDEETDIELANEFRSHELALERLAVDLQDHCYRHDQDQAKRLLTYELQAFSKNTCLSLAYMCESKVFIAHPCTQSILNDLWYGGLRKGDLVGAKVALILMGLIIPPLYPLIAFFFTKRMHPNHNLLTKLFMLLRNLIRLIQLLLIASKYVFCNTSPLPS